MFNFNQYLDWVFLEKEDLEKEKEKPSAKGLIIFVSSITLIKVLLSLFK